MKKIALLLVFSILLSFCSCGNSFSKTGMETLYKQSQDETALAYLTVMSYDYQDVADMKYYGEKFFLCSEEDSSKNYVALKTVLEKLYSFDNIEKATTQVYDSMLIYYIMCCIKNINSTQESSYSDFVPVYLECKSKFKQSYSDVLNQFTELITLGEFKESELEALYSFMHFSLPYLESEDVFSVSSFLQNISIQKEDDVQRDKYILIKNNINGGFGYNKEIAVALYSAQSKDPILNKDLQIEKIISYLETLTLPVDLKEVSLHFAKTPSYRTQNGIFFYSINNYYIIFYGAPSIVIEIIDIDTGEIVFERY